MITIEEKPHSFMGPSSFARVEACTASAILAPQGEAIPSDEYSFEGTVAHHIFEQLLRDQTLLPLDFIGEEFQQGVLSLVVDPDMVDIVASMVKIVRGFKGELFLEEQLSLDGGLIWGWTDAYVLHSKSRVSGPLLTLFDLKYGSGKVVPAEIVQTGLYILMAVLKHFGAEAITSGESNKVLANSVVLQPRVGAHAVKPHSWTRGMLSSLWVRAAAAAEMVRKGEIRYHVSEECRWCPITASCPALSAAARGAVVMSRDGGATALSQEQLDQAYAMLPALDLWSKSVVKAMMNRLERGHASTTAKLVMKRATRQWADEEKAKEWLTEQLGDWKQEPKLLSPNMAEEKLPRSLKVETHPGGESGLVHKVSSGMTLAPMEDERPPITLVAERARAAVRQQFARALVAKTRNAHKGDETDVE